MYFSSKHERCFTNVAEEKRNKKKRDTLPVLLFSSQNSADSAPPPSRSGAAAPEFGLPATTRRLLLRRRLPLLLPLPPLPLRPHRHFGDHLRGGGLPRAFFPCAFSLHDVHDACRVCLHRGATHCYLQRPPHQRPLQVRHRHWRGRVAALRLRDPAALRRSLPSAAAMCSGLDVRLVYSARCSSVHSRS